VGCCRRRSSSESGGEVIGVFIIFVGDDHGFEVVLVELCAGGLET
jgi:hypothetical protein